MKNINEFESLLVLQTDIFFEMRLSNEEEIAYLKKNMISEEDYFYEDFPEKWKCFQAIKNIPNFLSQESDTTKFNLRVKIYTTILQDINLFFKEINTNGGGIKYKILEKKVTRAVLDGEKKLQCLLGNNKEILEKLLLQETLAGESKNSLTLKENKI